MVTLRLNPVERARRNVCVFARRWRLALGQDLLTRALAKDLLLNALNHLNEMELRARAGLRRSRGPKLMWRDRFRSGSRAH